MRELTKSMLSYTWAMSIFGLQQMVNLLSPSDGDPGAKTVHAFDNVTEATTGTFGNAMKDAYKAGDSFQKGVLDLMFGGCAANGFDPGRWLRTGGDALRKAAQSAQQVAGFASA